MTEDDTLELFEIEDIEIPELDPWLRDELTKLGVELDDCEVDKIISDVDLICPD